MQGMPGAEGLTEEGQGLDGDSLTPRASSQGEPEWLVGGGGNKRTLGSGSA